MKLILLNGAPRSGKDTAALHLYNRLENFCLFDRLSMPIKAAFAALVNAPIDEFGNVADYENDKAKPIPLFRNSSYRQWQIDFSERFMKPLYGDSIFSKLFLLRLDTYSTMDDQYEKPLVVVVPDCGFQVEIDALAQEFPPEDIALFRIRRTGNTFEGDSRNWVDPHPKMFFREISNDDTKEVFEQKVFTLALEFLNGATS